MDTEPFSVESDSEGYMIVSDHDEEFCRRLPSGKTQADATIAAGWANMGYRAGYAAGGNSVKAEIRRSIGL